MKVPFQEWRPDLDYFANPGATVMLNVIPTAKGYKPLKRISSSTNALAARAQGAVAVRAPDGNTHNFAGDATALYKLVGNTWEDVSRETGGAYNTNDDENWFFTLFGSNLVASNLTDDTQVNNLGATNAKFQALANAPRFRYSSVVKDFFVSANLETAPNAVRWADTDSLTVWEVGIGLADQQIFPDGGWVQGIVGGEFGIIFQEDQIKRMTFTDCVTIFQFDTMERNRGCLAPGSIVTFGYDTWFLSRNGFYRFDGTQAIPIGAQRVDQYFFDNFDITRIDRVFGAADPFNKLIIWAYPDSNAVNGIPNRALIYAWDIDRWSEGEIDTQTIFSLYTQGLTLDDLDTISASLDALSSSLDSRVYTGSAPSLGAFNTSNEFGFLTGANLPAILGTQEVQLIEEKRALVQNIRPLTNAALCKMRVGTRERLADDPVFTDSGELNSAGECPVLASGRYHRAELSITSSATWSEAVGLEVKAVPDGDY